MIRFHSSILESYRKKNRIDLQLLLCSQLKLVKSKFLTYFWVKNFAFTSLSFGCTKEVISGYFLKNSSGLDQFSIKIISKIKIKRIQKKIPKTFVRIEIFKIRKNSRKKSQKNLKKKSEFSQLRFSKSFNFFGAKISNFSKIKSGFTK